MTNERSNNVLVLLPLLAHFVYITSPLTVGGFVVNVFKPRLSKRFFFKIIFNMVIY